MYIEFHLREEIFVSTAYPLNAEIFRVLDLLESRGSMGCSVSSVSPQPEFDFQRVPDHTDDDLRQVGF